MTCTQQVFPCPSSASTQQGSPTWTRLKKLSTTPLAPYRVNPRREFFAIEPQQAIGLLDLMSLEDMTPAIKKEAEMVDVEAKASAEKLKRSRRPSLNYLEMGIPVGSTLVFEGDGHTTCTVVDGRSVEFQGQITSISRLTAELRNTPGRPIRGPAHWSFNGRLLDELYEETYSDY